MVAEQTGEWPEEFPLPEVPDIAADIWEWFWSMRRSAGAGMNGPAAIRHSEMVAWQSLHGVSLLPQHVRLIEMMDAQYLTSVYDMQK